MVAQAGGLQALGPSKKVVGEYGQKWEGGETGETELLHFTEVGSVSNPSQGLAGGQAQAMLGKHWSRSRSPQREE